VPQSDLTPERRLIRLKKCSACHLFLPMVGDRLCQQVGVAGREVESPAAESGQAQLAEQHRRDHLTAPPAGLFLAPTEASAEAT